MKFFCLLIGLLAISTDTNNADVNAADMGYSPFTVQGENSSKDKTVIGIGSLFGAFAAVALTEPIAVVMGVTAVAAIGVVTAPIMIASAISGILGSAVMVFASRNNISPDALYQQVWGKIEIQVNSAINSKATSVLKERLSTLSQNLHDESTAYLAQLGITSVPDMIRQGNGHIVSARAVDLSMKAVDDILSASNSWISTTRIDYNNPDAFILVDAQGAGKDRCLHTRLSVLADGTDLVVDNQCNMNSLDGKLFAVNTNGALIMRTSFGDKCVTYKTSRWSHSYNNPLAIFALGSKECNSAKLVTLKHIQAGFSLFDGANMLCVSATSKKAKVNALVSTQGDNKCLNGNFLSFRSRLPVPLMKGSIVPALSFDEIGVQIFYFPTFASYHLTALKEMFLHGMSKNYARVQFQSKIVEYELYLSDYLPVFSQYANYTGLRAAQQINDAGSFAAVLQTATLNFTLQKMEFHQ